MIHLTTLAFFFTLWAEGSAPLKLGSLVVVLFVGVSEAGEASYRVVMLGLLFDAANCATAHVATIVLDDFFAHACCRDL